MILGDSLLKALPEIPGATIYSAPGCSTPGLLTQLKGCSVLQNMLHGATTVVLLIGTNDCSSIRSSLPAQVVTSRLSEIIRLLTEKYRIGTIALLKPPMKTDSVLNSNLEIRWTKIVDHLMDQEVVQLHEVNWKLTHTGRDGVHLSHSGVYHLKEYIKSIKRNKTGPQQYVVVKIGKFEEPEVTPVPKPEVKSLMPDRKRALLDVDSKRPKRKPHRGLEKRSKPKAEQTGTKQEMNQTGSGSETRKKQTRRSRKKRASPILPCAL